MDTWLAENRRLYRLFLGLTNLLLEQGFSPLSTPPASDRAFRTDHTEAIMALLPHFDQETVRWPLRVFSAGPLFSSQGIWSDAVDVEWVGSITARDQEEVLGVVAAMVRWLAQQRMKPADLLMVLGHVGWFRTLGEQLGLSPPVAERLIDDVRRGRLTVVQDHIAVRSQDAAGLFIPQAADQFFATLGKFFDVRIPPLPAVCWQTRWDLALTGRRNYYTGLVFSLYHRYSPEPLVQGGQFAIPGAKGLLEGMGFTVNLDACRMAVGGVPYVL